jgi:hypothetical protein
LVLDTICFLIAVKSEHGTQLPRRRKLCPHVAICHGSWKAPDDQGRSRPLYVDKKRGVFETQIDIALLKQLQKHIAELACTVVSTVTQMGFQFPGSSGTGKPVFGVS